jgi:hypothetical protein
MSRVGQSNERERKGNENVAFGGGQIPSPIPPCRFHPALCHTVVALRSRQAIFRRGVATIFYQRSCYR